MTGSFLAALVGAWWVAVASLSIPSYIVPTPLQVWQTLIRVGFGFLPDVWTTTQEVLAGFALGLVGGLALALVMARWSAIRTGMYPLLIFSQVVPIFVVSVVVTIAFVNDGILPQISVTALYSFLPFVVNGLAGLDAVDAELVRLLRAAGASEWQIFKLVRVPAALPSLFSGAKLAMIFAVGAAAISEWIGAGSGLGFYMRDQNDLFRIREVFAGALVLSCLGALLFGAVALSEYVALPWNRSERMEKTTLWKAG